MADSRNSFMIIGSTFSRLKEKIKRLKDNEEKDVETFLPILAGVGEVESMFDLSEYYVFCGNVCYKLENIIHSLDIAFKMFNVLNLRYPPHCKLVWFFIQEYFYEIKIPTQEKSNSLAELLNDVNIRKVQ